MKNRAFFILLLVNSVAVAAQNTTAIKFKPEYDDVIDDSTINELSRIPDSLAFVGIDDSEFCIKFPGGDSALLNYLRKNFTLPTKAKDLPIEGRVLVSFTLNEKGNVGHIKIERSLCENIDALVVKVISEMPNWTWDCKEKPQRHILIKRYLPIIIGNEK